MAINEESICKLASIHEIKEVVYPYDVNAHIKIGWVLLETFKVAIAQDTQAVNYIIGWPKDLGEIKIPEKSYAQVKAEKTDSMLTDY